MNHLAAQTLARELMHAHRLVAWAFQFDAGVRRLGCCHFPTSRRAGRITLSYDLTAKASEELIKNTILHEIAHAIAGVKAGHGPTWKAIAVSIGCTGERCYDYHAVEPVKGLYEAVCPSCQTKYYMHRMIKKNSRRWCTPCGSVRGQLKFIEIQQHHHQPPVRA